MKKRFFSSEAFGNISCESQKCLKIWTLISVFCSVLAECEERQAARETQGEPGAEKAREEALRPWSCARTTVVNSLKFLSIRRETQRSCVGKGACSGGSGRDGKECKLRAGRELD